MKACALYPSDLYAVALPPDRDIACTFAKRAPSKITHTGSRAYKNKECVHMHTRFLCVLTSLSGGRETEYIKVCNIVEDEVLKLLSDVAMASSDLSYWPSNSAK